MNIFIGIVFLLGLSATGSAGAELADPTRPAIVAPKVIEKATGIAVQPAPDWRVSIIKRSIERAQAVINGQSVEVGDELDGAEIEAIEADHVIMRLGQKRIVIRLDNRPSIKKRVRIDTSRSIAKGDS